MAAALSTLHYLQASAQIDAMSRIGEQRAAERFIDFDLERSRPSRRRHRILVSAQRVTALFDSHAGRN